MAIFNANGGGSNFTYKVEISKEKPQNVGNKNILWIKDDLTNLIPYDKSITPTINTITFPEAYQKAGTTTKKSSKFVTDYVIYMHKSETKSTFYKAINASKPHISVRINKQDYHDIYFGVSNIKPDVDGVPVYNVVKAYHSPIDADENDEEKVVKSANYALTADDNSNIVYQIYNQTETYFDIYFNQNSLVDLNGNLYKYLIINYSGDYTTAPKASEHSSSFAIPSTAISSSIYGDIKKNIVIADEDNIIDSEYIIIDPNKIYKIYPKGNTGFQLFTINYFPSYVKNEIPAEGCEGKIINIDQNHKDINNVYFIVKPEDCNNNLLCFCWNKNEEKPIVEDYTHGYNIKEAYNKQSPIKERYIGYYINNFEPKDLKAQTTNKELPIWFMSGNNNDINFKIVNSLKKKHYTSIKSALAYFHLPNEPEEYLYFLKGEFYDCETKQWYSFLEDASTNDDLINLIQGTLTTLHNDNILKVTDYAFLSQSALKSVNLSNCENIGTSAFQNCYNLNTVILPQWRNGAGMQFLKLSNSDSSPFAGCTQIIAANIGLSYIGNPVFTDGSVTGLGDAATVQGNTYHKNGFSPFNSARSTLQDLTMLKCSLINSSAFQNYTALKKLTFGYSSGIDIGAHAFQNCIQLETINGASNISVIRSATFQSCPKLNNIDLRNVQWINLNAFSECTNLTTIGTLDNVSWVGQNAFYNTNISSFIAPNCNNFSGNTEPSNVCNVIGSNINATPFAKCNNLQQITLGISCGTGYLSRLFTGDNFPRLNSLNLYNISSILNVSPSYVTGKYGCFKTLSYLSYIKLSDALVKIGNTAFQDCATIKEDVRIEELLDGQTQKEFVYKIIEDKPTYGTWDEETQSWIYDPTKIQYENNLLDLSDINIQENIVDEEEQIYKVNVYKTKTSSINDILYTYTIKKQNDKIQILGTDEMYYDIFTETIPSVNMKFVFSPNRQYQIIPSNKITYEYYTDSNQHPYLTDPETGEIIYDDNGNPRYNEEINLFDLTKPKCHEAQYSDELLYVKETDENNIPILDSNGNFQYKTLNNQYYGLKYVNYPTKDPNTGENISPLEGLDAPGIQTIGILAFQNCSNLHEFHMSNGGGSIMSGAFSNCINLKVVNAPLCPSISSTALDNCPSISYLNLSNASINITNNNKYNLYSFFNQDDAPKYPLLEELHLNNAFAATIPSSCFKNLEYFTTASFESCEIIGDEAFYSTAFKYLNSSSQTPGNLNIPNIKQIGNKAFMSCKNLTAGQFPSSIEMIGNECFRNCSNLTNIFGKPDGLNFDNILYLNTIKSIGDYAFANCYGINSSEETIGITTVNIPNTISQIGVSAFIGCNKLTNLSFENPEMGNDELQPSLIIGSNAFFSCPISSVIIPAHVTKINNGAFVLNPSTQNYTIDLTAFSSFTPSMLETPTTDINGYHAFGITTNGLLANNDNINIKVRPDLVSILKTMDNWKIYEQCFNKN